MSPFAQVNSVCWGCKKLLWDPTALRFTNSKEATAFLRREYRQGWSI